MNRENTRKHKLCSANCITMQFMMLLSCCSVLFTMDKIHRLHNDTIDVLQFGIVADGKTDNTAALNKICDTVPSNAVIVFPPGNYYIKEFISIRRSYLSFIGTDARIILGESRNLQPYTGFFVRAVQNVKFHGITFVGKNNENESAIWVENCDSIDVTFCKFIDIGFVAVMLTNVSKSLNSHGSRFCNILNNYFKNISVIDKNLGSAIFIFSNGSFNRIENNVIYGTGWIGIGIDDATTNSTPPYFPSNYNIIKNNSIYQTKGPGILVEGSHHNQVVHNKLVECKTGVLLNNIQHQNSSDSNIVQDNYFLKSVENAISIVGSSFNNISNNNIEFSGNHGINLQLVKYPDAEIGSTNNSIYSNIINFSHGFGVNINDEKCRTNTFKDNIFNENYLGNTTLH